MNKLFSGRNCKIGAVFSYFESDTLVNKVYYYEFNSGQIVISRAEYLRPVVEMSEVSEDFKKIIAPDQYKTLREYNLNKVKNELC